jgi:hypothetical protein
MHFMEPFFLAGVLSKHQDPLAQYATLALFSYTTANLQ